MTDLRRTAVLSHEGVTVKVYLTVAEGRLVVAIEMNPSPTEEPPVDVYVGEERVWKGEL